MCPPLVHPVRFTAYRQPLCWNFTNCFVRRWFCMVHGPKPPLHHHNWLSFVKFQDTKLFLIPCPRHVSSRLPPSGETCKYTKPPITQTNLDRFSTYWYAPFCCVCLDCCTAEFGISGGTYELPCIYCLVAARKGTYTSFNYVTVKRFSLLPSFDVIA
jgi:hypothetical protein